MKKKAYIILAVLVISGIAVYSIYKYDIYLDKEAARNVQLFKCKLDEIKNAKKLCAELAGGDESKNLKELIDRELFYTEPECAEDIRDIMHDLVKDAYERDIEKHLTDLRHRNLCFPGEARAKRAQYFNAITNSWTRFSQIHFRIGDRLLEENEQSCRGKPIKMIGA